MRPGSKPPSSQTCSADGSTAPAAVSRAKRQRERGITSVLAVLPVAHEETRAGLLAGRGRERPVDAVGEEARRHALVRPDLDHRLAADGLATLHGRGRGEAQQLRARVTSHCQPMEATV